MADLRILRDIPTDLIDDAAQLLVEAFGLKLENELRARSAEQALRLVAGSMAPDLGLVALDSQDEVVGVLGDRGAWPPVLQSELSQADA